MNKSGILLLSFALSMFGSAVFAQTVEEQIAERIEKVGSVCIEGQDCVKGGSGGTATASGGGETTVAAADSGFDPEATYNKTCATCHNAGVAGAPKFGDAEAWVPRIEKGKEALYQSAINGLPPGMPAKGMCFNCSNEELKALVDYMMNAAQ